MEENISTKDSIIRSGIDLFARNAYSDVSVDSIVEAAGVSKGSFYYYFKSKEQFYQYLLSYAFSNLIELYKKNAKGKKTKEGLLEAFCNAVFESFEQDKNRFFLIQKELLKIIMGEKSDFLNYHKKVFELLKAILQDEEEIVCFYVMGILRSSIIYHIRTGEPLEAVSKKTVCCIKKLLSKKKCS